MPRRVSANSASIGSISGEWNAWLTVRRLVLRPCAVNTSATARAAFSSPETTTERGPFTAAMSTSPAASLSCTWTSSSVASTATIAPPVGRACINRPRAATSAHASASENTPATCAAAISPMECPSR